jgi:hypothetical protein
MRWGGRSRLRWLWRGRLRRGRGLRLRRIRRLALERCGGRGQRSGRGRLSRARFGGGHCTWGTRGTPRRGPDAGLDALDMGRTWLGCPHIRSVGAREGKQRNAHRRHDPHCDSRGGDRRSRMSADAGPTQSPYDLREPGEPDRFRAPGYPSAIRRRILSRGGTAAQDLLSKFRGERGRRQEPEERRRAHRAPSVMGAGLAVLDMPADQFPRLIGQLPIPVGQQLSQCRARIPPGKQDMQREQGFF